MRANIGFRLAWKMLLWMTKTCGRPSEDLRRMDAVNLRKTCADVTRGIRRMRNRRYDG